MWKRQAPQFMSLSNGFSEFNFIRFVKHKLAYGDEDDRCVLIEALFLVQ